MSAIIPFESQAKLPAYLANRKGTSINADVLTGSSVVYPVLSIKGKVFTLVKGSERKVLTREIDGEQEAVQSLQLTVARANTKYRVFYAKAFNEAESDGAKPNCFSHDGITPDSAAREPQSKKCQGCPQNVWGVRDGKGTACSVKTRLAVVDPNNLDNEPFLLNVPAASRKSFAQAVEAAEARGIDYNALVMRVSFDKEAPSPKLVFKPVGWLDDAAYKKVSDLYQDELVLEMVGAAKHAAAAEDEPTVDTGELDAAIAARTAVETAKASAKPVEKAVEPEPEAEKPKAAPKAKAQPKPAEKASKAADDLLADIDNLLGSMDD